MKTTLLVLGLVLVLVLALAYGGATRGRAADPSNAIPIGIMGDSDSQSYQGRIRLGDSAPAGGAFHSSTFQWPEVLARMRSGQVDLGDWNVWGVPRWLSMARLRDGLGLRWRGPRKEDYRNNVAWATGCAALNQGPWRQTQRLVEIMDEAPDAWRRGVVVIRIGVNDFGKEPLDLLAADSQAPEVHALMRACTDQITAAIHLIRQHHPSTRIVLVGIFNNAHWTDYFERFKSPQGLRRIDAGLDAFDDSLRAIARALPGVAFFDDRAWFARHWGGRDAEGRPAYKTVVIDKGLQVSNTSGDSPDNAVLANTHAGLVWNVLWVQELVFLMRSTWQMPIDPISDDEVRSFLAATLRKPR
jgi:hypothetical protein